MSTDTNRPINRKVTLKSHPDGLVEPTDFEVSEEPAPEPGDGEVLIKTEYMSIDAFIRVSLNAAEGLHTSVPIGGVVYGLGVGRIVESNDPNLAVGDGVFGPMGAQTYGVMPGQFMTKVDESMPISTYLGALGLTTGMTAYVGMLIVAGVKEGETVLVSGAAGAVGSIAGQLAKIKGARVIGIAGGPDKMKFLTETLGFDAGIDYKNEDVDAKIKELAPDGIDVFFDNVGGDILEAAIANIRMHGRVSICGAISQYNDHANVRGPSNYLKLAESSARLEGFVVSHYEEQFPKVTADLIEWTKSGQLKMPEHIEEGVDSFPMALQKLFTGGHMGKLLVKM